MRITKKEVLDKLNKVKFDDGRKPYGVFALDKPAGITSHDLVDRLRKVLGTGKVGHAGALDPFATGIMILCVGKYTKALVHFLFSPKEYQARVLYGASSKTLDTEKDISLDPNFICNENQIRNSLENFPKKYIQKVPIYSSVKLSGMKLRELARNSDYFEVHDYKAIFYFSKVKSNKIKRNLVDGKIEIDIPTRNVEIDIKIIDIGKEKIMKNEICYADIVVTCSKGTYIRQLGMDIADRLGTIGMISSLRRTRVGKLGFDSITSLESISNQIN